tara:strand:- start:4186 stop:4686 length:501 start_codon:yes stop_codon:yes gene_type:complete
VNKVFLSIGSNEGNRLELLRSAIRNIKNLAFVEYLNHSFVYETRPMYNMNQPYFLNMVIEIQTSIKPLELLDATQGIERKIGRKKTYLKNQSRVIDIDILDYDNRILNDEQLILPHPGIIERMFVLKPWSDINPEYILPNMEKSIFELMSDIKLEANVIKLYTKII